MWIIQRLWLLLSVFYFPSDYEEIPNIKDFQYICVRACFCLPRKCRLLNTDLSVNLARRSAVTCTPKSYYYLKILFKISLFLLSSILPFLHSNGFGSILLSFSALEINSLGFEVLWIRFTLDKTLTSIVSFVCTEN